MINGLYPFIQCGCLLYRGEDTQNLILLVLVLGAHSTAQEDAYLFSCIAQRETLLEGKLFYCSERIF